MKKVAGGSRQEAGATAQDASPWSAAAWRRNRSQKRGEDLPRLKRIMVAPGRDRPKRRRAGALQGSAPGGGRRSNVEVFGETKR